MKAKLIEHALSVLLVTCGFIILVRAFEEKETAQLAIRTNVIEPYVRLDFLDFGNPLHAALFKETLTIFHPESPALNDSVFAAIQAFRQEQFTNRAYKTGVEEQKLSGPRLLKLGNMYAQFILIYLIIMILSYRAAQSLAVFRFVKMKQGRSSYLAESYKLLRGSRQQERGLSFFLQMWTLLLKASIKAGCYAVLFSPAYVIAYSIRSSFDTDSYMFMIVLGVISNGLLINYANKFFTFLVHEGRKGYVQTAIVKNLNASYEWNTLDGVPRGAVLRPRGLFPSHVFRHIYLNARYQYLPSIKEHASFLITGLIIIEMALNIQGHLGYELLQNILYRQYDVVLSIILGIFLLVKTTEIVVDAWFHLESRKYENKTR